MSGQHATPGRMRDLVESFDALALQGKTRPLAPRAQPPYPPSGNVGGSIYADSPSGQNNYRYPTHGYVGGFAAPNPPTPTAAPPRLWASSASHGTNGLLPPLPRPPAMPKPHHHSISRTMQYASQDMPPAAMPMPPDTAPLSAPPPRLRPGPVTPSKSDGKGKDRLGGPLTPQPPKIAPPIHHRANSAPESPAGPGTGESASSNPDMKDVTVQCAGITAAGLRCKKTIKVDAARAATETDVFCHQHEKKMHEPTGFYDRKTGEKFIKFDEWIPKDLQPSTRASLRSEMQKARSASDREGIIYAFVIRDESDSNSIHFKVGRAINLNRRMDQWARQCGSKEQVLRGYWPGGLDSDQPTMRGLIQAEQKGAWCHRAERLIHLELADLATYTPYMDPSFFLAGKSAADSADASQRRAKPEVKRCPDCGRAHKEIFTLERIKSGEYQGKEWSHVILPVIEKWGGFVDAYV